MPLGSTSHLDGFARASLPPEETWPTLEFSIPEVVYPERLNAATALIDGGVSTFGADRPCLGSPSGQTWTYGEVLARANQVAHVLSGDLGIVPGNRVLLRGPNTPWLAIVWLAVLKAGAVAVTTMHVLRAAELDPILDATRPQLALCDSRYLDGLADLDPALLPGRAVVAFDVALDGGELGRRADSKPTVYSDVETSADDVALMAPTSGTTGKPKITVHFHRDILANADTFARHVLRPVADDVFTGTPPLAFTFGLGGLVVFPLRFGASTLLIERATPPDLADYVERFGVTVLFTAPTAYRAIIREGVAGKLRGVRRAVSAGEHLPEAVWREVRDHAGLELINGIGSTEMLHIFISAADDSIRPGSTGRVVPGYRATILDDDGNEAPIGALGRLAVIGPTGCRYLHGDRQGNYVESGWNVTGDTYRRDEDGYFWYEARSDSMIISSGFNIGAPEVESALCVHPDVVEAGVVGAPDAERGAIVTAFVVLRDGVRGDSSKRLELQSHVKATLAPYKYPRELHFVEALPRNPSGKLQHFRLRERLQTRAGNGHELDDRTPVQEGISMSDELRWDRVPQVTRAGHEDTQTLSSGGGVRVSGVGPQHTEATRIWFGQVSNEPGYRSLPHHHGEAETGGYVLRGRGRIYFGDGYGYEQWLDMTAGDWVFVPPFMPHVEANMSTTEELVWLTARTPDNIVVNLPEVDDAQLEGFRRG